MDIKDWMIEDISKDLVLMLMEDQRLDLSQALETLYNSDTYSSLTHFENGMYTKSSIYIYDCLIAELTTGRMN